MVDDNANDVGVLWVDKYRPTDIDDYVLNADLKEYFKNMIKSKTLQNCTFLGLQGSGKTTLTKILAKAFDAEVLFVKCATEGTVDVLRTKVAEFCNALTIDGKIKIVMNADDVNDGIISKLSGISNFKMSFEDGKVCMNGKTTIPSLPFNLFTQGDISAGPNNTVKYSIESIRVEGFEITNVIGEIVRNLLNFNFKLPDLPFALTLDSIDIQNDTIVFNGTSNR